MSLRALSPRESTVDACGRSLREAVLAGRFEQGVRLPPERELAVQLGVNRVTVRGALARLVTEGLLTVRQGSGYVVRDFRQQGGPELLATLARQSDARGLGALAADLLEVRRGIARVVLERLAQKPPRKRALDALGRAIDALERLCVPPAPPEDLARADLEVLAAVVDATESTAFRLLINPVSGVVLAMPALQAAMFRAPLENVAGWRLLHAWLEQPAPEGVEQILAVLAVLAERDAQTVALLKRTRIPGGLS
jgi:DNA-binding FadR family transcriptional regulator